MEVPRCRMNEEVCVVLAKLYLFYYQSIAKMGIPNDCVRNLFFEKIFAPNFKSSIPEIANAEWSKSNSEIEIRLLKRGEEA